MDDFIIIVSRDGKMQGKAQEDNELYCEMEGCNGTQYVVKWEDKEETIVCGCGLKWINEGKAQII